MNEPFDNGILIPVLTAKEYFDLTRNARGEPQSQPSPGPSTMPTVRSKSQLKTAADRSAFISAHGGKAFLALPKE